ncbi:unnamed protein product [Eruca vesicaria subsp. sativa]|uniref:Uncharacterized protein n=1 Tax=Eruca vesicaria subsp. sativa TaxID=29727 RepID=A0ABC8IZ29_ERUVS|nr:unnamed protein product [Eruca vesicaria subsp. sativa]
MIGYRGKCHTWFMKRVTSVHTLPALPFQLKDTSCELVVTSGLEPTRVAEIVKDQLSWLCKGRAVDVMNVLYFYKALEK